MVIPAAGLISCRINYPVESQKSAIRKALPFIIKIALTAAAMVFVFRKIDAGKFLEALRGVNPWYFIASFLMFNASKIVSAYRLNVLYRLAGIRLSEKINLQFYYLGMFYNMFLPGSVGGDAYKVYLLREHNKESSTKKLIAAALLDRISGLAFLFLMTGVFLWLSTFHPELPYYNWLLLAATALVLPGYYLFNKWFFPTFVPGFASTSVYSFFVQAGQVLSAWLLLRALHIDAFTWDYLALFMISSVFAVIPLTIGGAGARELVFIFGATYLQIHQPSAVAFAILFFCVSALSSLVGLAFMIGIDKKLLQQEPNA